MHHFSSRLLVIGLSSQVFFWFRKSVCLASNLLSKYFSDPLIRCIFKPSTTKRGQFDPNFYMQIYVCFLIPPVHTQLVRRQLPISKGGPECREPYFYMDHAYKSVWSRCSSPRHRDWFAWRTKARVPRCAPLSRVIRWPTPTPTLPSAIRWPPWPEARETPPSGCPTWT